MDTRSGELCGAGGKYAVLSIHQKSLDLGAPSSCIQHSEAKGTTYESELQFLKTLHEHAINSTIMTLKLKPFGSVEVMSISIYEKTTTLILLELQLVYHFIENTNIYTN
jgi:hypothetical protein